MVSEQQEEHSDGDDKEKDKSKPLTTKPLISSLNRLTSHDTNNPPAGMRRIVWLLGSQDPIPETFDTGRHLIRMESEDKGGSEAEETREELTMREIGSILPETARDDSEEEKKRSLEEEMNLTSFFIMQIIDKNYLSGDEGVFITKLDSETKEKCWVKQ
jgi:hypothetical protein